MNYNSNIPDLFSIQLFASRECPMCEFPSAINFLVTAQSVVLQCQTCKREYLYRRVKSIDNNLLGLVKEN